jgi:hypothetical protein
VRICVWGGAWHWTGHHVVHVYAAANEPYDLWEGMSRSSPEYKRLKEERAEVRIYAFMCLGVCCVGGEEGWVTARHPRLWV